ncbi:MAG: bifunctional aspartate kinase/homoserine dehydrogenase I [Myxococcales bacterium]|nr:bifunctional aspartate kinase/homoserine dehydrogenase I [Myxococcales bacterium]
MRVLKFGGSSVANAGRIASVIEIVKRANHAEAPLTVVVSAFSGVTDALLGMVRQAAVGDEAYLARADALREQHRAAAGELCGTLGGEFAAGLEAMHADLVKLLQGAALLREASAQTLDQVAGFGERNSAFIIAHAMCAKGLPAQFLDARRVIRTDAHFGAAHVDVAATDAAVAAHYASHAILQVVTGFIGSTKDNQTTTLGRGGSDYTAAILAASLRASVVEIWTDVDGVMTADPRKVARAFSIPKMTYAEALEMSHFGAKVIYPPTILPALKNNIPLLIKNTFNPAHPGTLVSHESPEAGTAVRGISSVSHVALLTLQGSGMVGVPGTAARLFAGLAQHDVNVILITQGSSEHSITFAVTPEAAAIAKHAVQAAFALELASKLVEPVRVETDMAVVAVIGEGMRTRPGVAGRLFSALGANGINTVAITQGSSELNISVVIPRLDEGKALAALHEAFFLSKTKELNLFLIGTGVVGKTLLAQIDMHADFLRQHRGVQVNVIAIADSKRMVFDRQGLPLANWTQRLAADGRPTSLPAFVDEMIACRLPSSIFIDCTASEAVPALYSDILQASISISTPNKIAMSSDLARSRELKALAERRGVILGYETNVGAGLPVITTLNDLLQSGDRIIKLEGVLSGSLSYVFNHWKPGTPFSALVAQAKSLGYTEPDPRQDLSGHDVRRKLLILGRECGLPLLQDNVTIDNFIVNGAGHGAAAFAAPDAATFMNELAACDDALGEKLAEATASDRVLRFAASLDHGRARIGVQAFEREHPFASLGGSENMLVFTTERYKDRPLVIRGPGAGADVTAAGVFAEVLRIGATLFSGRSNSW